ncbi:MAG: hypothetical protein ACREXS_00675 [Gammaproteobacteria bacterium]
MKLLVPPQSGSHDGLTASRNSFGQYMRTRAIPVNPASSAQGAARARLAAYAALWRTLTDAQRAGWESLGVMMVRTDSLGQQYTLSGFLAYVAVNSARVAAGDAAVTDAPALVTPPTPLTATVTLTAIAFSIAYTPTPLGAGQRLWGMLSPQRSAGRNYESDYRLVQVSAAAAASPLNVLAAYTARLGVPVVGNRIFWALQTYQAGFLSGPLYGSQVVV